jgi:UDP-N-acetylmuramoylalanine--D-glutamate ligase
MIDFAGKRVLIVGLARSGRAVARFLLRRGAVVTVTDSRPPAEFGAELSELLAEKMGLEIGAHPEEIFLAQDLIVVSPGVPWGLPQLLAARRHGIPVLPEVEVASWFLEGTLVGITGTNGKTTTTALLGKMLEASGFPTFVGGNIGVPLISAVDQVAPGSIFVAELSSFQLEAIQDLRPHVAVLLNLTPNHLDRHASFADYATAKAQIFRNQTAEDYAVLNADDPTMLGLAPALASQKVFFSRQQDLPDGVLALNGKVVYRVKGLERVLFETREVPLPGVFNLENVLAATAAACVLGADFGALRKAVAEFRAVEHRLEYVREIRGVKFYNDSKATSVDATAKALSAFDRPIYLILGGKDKGAPYAPLRPLIEARVRCLFLIGAAADRIAEELGGSARLVRSGNLETAVGQAFEAAEPGDIVLLSPACASFDQFHDFEHRGRVFKEIVERLGRALGDQMEDRQVETREPQNRESATQSRDHRPHTANPKLGTAESRASKPGLLESVSVYEVGGEEVLPLEGESRTADPEDFQPVSSQDLRPLERVEDEPLPFESLAHADGQAEPIARSAGNESSSADPAPSKSSRATKRTKGQ